MEGPGAVLVVVGAAVDEGAARVVVELDTLGAGAPDVGVTDPVAAPWLLPHADKAAASPTPSAAIQPLPFVMH